MTCLVAYDIRDDERRRLLVRFLARNGKRVAKSLFAVCLSRHRLNRFRLQVQGIVGNQSSVAILRLCEGCERSARTLSKKSDNVIIV